MEVQIQETLTNLQVKYLDLYLTHMPFPVKMVNGNSQRSNGPPMYVVWSKLEEFHNRGLVKNLGISNYPGIMVNDLMGYAKILPIVNEIERHPRLPQTELITFCRSLGIEIMSFGVIGSLQLIPNQKNPIICDERILEIAKKHSRTAQQVLIRWQLQTGCVSITKSSTKERIFGNFDCDFQLDEDDMKKIATLECGERLYSHKWSGVAVFY